MRGVEVLKQLHTQTQHKLQCIGICHFTLESIDSIQPQVGGGHSVACWHSFVRLWYNWSDYNIVPRLTGHDSILDRYMHKVVYTVWEYVFTAFVTRRLQLEHCVKE